MVGRLTLGTASPGGRPDCRRPTRRTPARTAMSSWRSSRCLLAGAPVNAVGPTGVYGVGPTSGEQHSPGLNQDTGAAVEIRGQPRPNHHSTAATSRGSAGSPHRAVRRAGPGRRPVRVDVNTCDTRAGGLSCPDSTAPLGRGGVPRGTASRGNPVREPRRSRLRTRECRWRRPASQRTAQPNHLSRTGTRPAARLGTSAGLRS